LTTNKPTIRIHSIIVIFYVENAFVIFPNFESENEPTII